MILEEGKGINMVNFHIKLDEKFDELIKTAKINKNQISLDDLVELKSYICDIYATDNDFENSRIRVELNRIEFRI